jgi:hypothetical protein
MSCFADLLEEWRADEGRHGFCTELEQRPVPLPRRTGADGLIGHYTALDPQVPVPPIAEMVFFDQLRHKWTRTGAAGKRRRRTRAVDELLEALHQRDLARVQAASSRPVQISVQIPVPPAASSPPAPQETRILAAGPEPAGLPEDPVQETPASPAPRPRTSRARPGPGKRLVTLYERRMREDV